MPTTCGKLFVNQFFKGDCKMEYQYICSDCGSLDVFTKIHNGFGDLNWFNKVITKQHYNHRESLDFDCLNCNNFNTEIEEIKENK